VADGWPARQPRGLHLEILATTLPAWTGWNIVSVVPALASLWACACLGGRLFAAMKMPRVVGEIVGGLLLGPTGLGFFFPGAFGWLFGVGGAGSGPGQEGLLGVVYWSGLVLLMFVAGFELKAPLAREDKPLLLALLAGATLIPFLAGWVAPLVYDFTGHMGPNATPRSLQILVAIAAAVTSIPVLSRMFMDLGILGTRFSSLVLRTAAIQDLLLWVALGVAVALAQGGAAEVIPTASALLAAVGLFGMTRFLPPRFRQLSSLKTEGGGMPVLARSRGPFLLACSLVLALLWWHPVLGAFMAGIMAKVVLPGLQMELYPRLKWIALHGLVPLYFAMVGLKLDLLHQFDLRFFLGFLGFTSLFAIAGSLIALKVAGKDWLSCLNVGLCMNARGGPGIILASVALEAGLINAAFFAVLVLTAVVTTLLAGCWLRLVLRAGLPLLKE
jgi:Kef-type K+ transport system membrane component KefB